MIKMMCYYVGLRKLWIKYSVFFWIQYLIWCTISTYIGVITYWIKYFLVLFPYICSSTNRDRKTFFALNDSCKLVDIPLNWHFSPKKSLTSTKFNEYGMQLVCGLPHFTSTTLGFWSRCGLSHLRTKSFKYAFDY